MKKTEAVKILITDFQNNLIAQGINNINDIEDDTDREMAKALKIEFAPDILYP